jgi:PIN domain nuclease of toxin-antitoxin system
METVLHKSGFKVLDVQLDHAMAAASLPRYHQDPFDRMLIAQAMAENLELLTVDEQILRYGIEPLR